MKVFHFQLHNKYKSGGSLTKQQSRLSEELSWLYLMNGTIIFFLRLLRRFRKLETFFLFLLTSTAICQALLPTMTQQD